MRITLKSHGGWSGLVTPPVVIDTEALPADAASEGLRLAAAAAASPGPTEAALAAGRARAPEAMTQAITIEDGDRTVTLKSSDVEAHPGVQALAEWVKRQGGQ